ncbi:nucleoid-associated protein [Mangrovihabitans endophyticus]|uniref:Nucleoid-associated protein n=2 Tax=Mangrovihabitans endophyticus TaxID=1751298 RepID=A0A8J3BU52_9ACTN|nr:nucleoid-associated protein [Mangrovihabitans endophyticus]
MTSPGMKDLLKRVEAMQAHLSAVRENLSDTEVTGTAHGGAVAIRVTVTGEFRAVRIDPEVLELGQDETEQAVLSALRDIAEQIRTVSEQRAAQLPDILTHFA